MNERDSRSVNRRQLLGFGDAAVAAGVLSQALPAAAAMNASVVNASMVKNYTADTTTSSIPSSTGRPTPPIGYCIIA